MAGTLIQSLESAGPACHSIAYWLVRGTFQSVSRDLTSIELFTGGGGLALGMEAEGFHHLLAVEWDHRAAETLRKNRAADAGAAPQHSLNGSRRWPLIEGDTRRVDFTPWQGKVDVVAGGVPCQPWSLGGVHRGNEDERNLWPELFRTVREVRPLAVLAENVRGLMRPSFRPYYDYILRELAAPFERRVVGEDWQGHDARLRRALARPSADAADRYDVFLVPVNAADYGVPQVRQRVFVIAFRSDLGLGGWSPPAASHSESALVHSQVEGRYWASHSLDPRPPLVARQAPRGDPSLQPWRTLRDAIRDLPEPRGDKIETPGFLHHFGWPGARVYTGHTPNVLDRPAKTVKAGVHGVPGGETVLRRDDGSVRYMTVREVARVMTFPDDWWLAGPRGEQMRQLGNAVPTDLARVMARAVRNAIRG